MAFSKTAKTQIIAYSTSEGSSFSKAAGINKIASHYGDNASLTASNIREKLEVVADTYKISNDPKDYIYVAVRALTADVPNENNDAFSEKELLRFDQKHACKTYQTFYLKPHHVNHRSADATQARGVILDVHYNTKNAEHFPELLVAVDKTKDRRLAEGIASGELTGFSMGCTADWTVCSICNNKAASAANFCNHIRFHKGKEVDGKVAFEWCEGVTFEEESSVDDPADKKAITQEVILANKQSQVNSLEIESEFLTVNSKLNNIAAAVNKIAEGTSMSSKSEATIDKTIPVQVKDTEEVAPQEMDPEEKKKNDKLKRYKKEVDDDDNAKISNEEFGVKTDTVAQGTEDIQAATDKKSEAGDNRMADNKKENPYAKLVAERKEALDKDGLGYWKEYFSDYGTDMTKDVKRKKVKADKGQMFKSVDSAKGNAPKDFKIDSKKGNPPKEWKQSDKVADKGQKFKSLDNGKGNPPKEYGGIDKKKGNPPKEWKFANLHADVEVFPVLPGFFLVAKSKTPLYIVANPEKDNKDIKASEKVAIDMCKGIASKGLVDTMKTYNAHKLQSLYKTVKKPNVSQEFSGDIRDKALRKPQTTKGIESDGKTDLGGIDKSKVKEKGVDQDGVNTVKLSSADIMKKRIADLNTIMDKMKEEQQKGTDEKTVLKIIQPMVEEGADKAASVTDDAVRDLGKDGIKPEANKGATADGTVDLAKSGRGDVRDSKVYGGGKDDLTIDRKNIVDIKAERKAPVLKKLEALKTAQAEKIKAEVSKEVDAAKKSLHEASLKEMAEFKKAFRQKYIRALKLASVRANINLIDNELKIAFGDVLITPTEEYIGMDGELATDIIEASFQKGGSAYIDSIVKEAEEFIEMPEESFLKIEEDTKKLNLVLPVADVSSGSPEGAGGFTPEDDLGLMPIEDQPEALVNKASVNNPIALPKEGSISKFENLRGVFKTRLS